MVSLGFMCRGLREARMLGAALTVEFDRLLDSWLVGQTVVDIERELILRTLAFHHGCRTRAARDLKISVRTLHNKINVYKLSGVAVPAPTDRRNIARPLPSAILEKGDGHLVPASKCNSQVSVSSARSSRFRTWYSGLNRAPEPRR